MTNPCTNPEEYDELEFDGIESPGVVKLSNYGREQSLDIQEADGQKGAAVKWKGVKVASFDATFTLAYDPVQGIDDFEEWDYFAERLRSTVPPKSGKNPVAKDIWHPDLERNGINSVILAKMGDLVHDGRGGATITVKLSEYYPPKPAKTGGASGSKSSGGDKKPKEDPNDPLVQARRDLQAAIDEGKKP